MSHIRKYPVLLGIILILLFILVRFVMPRPHDFDFQLAKAVMNDFEIRVNTVGVLDAARAHMVSSKLKGDKGKIISIVDDGTMVKQDDLLIKFDPTPFETEVLRLTGELRSKESGVEALKQVLEWEKSQAEGAVKNAEFNLKDAEQELERYTLYINDLEELSRKGYSHPSEIVQAKKKAEQLYAKQQKAKVDLEQTRKEGVFKIAKAMATLEKTRSELATTRLYLQDAQQQLKKTVLYAPFSGIAVLYETFRDNQKRKPRVGDTVWQNQPLLYLPDISSMIVKTQVREVDLHKISIGQKATVQVDAYPDALFEGEVTAVGVLATEKLEGGRGEKFFQLTVSLKNKDTRLRPGMTARLFILTDSVKNTLSVPIQSVFNESGKKYCFVYTGKKFRRVEVSLGKQNEDVAEIRSGLKEGDTVSLVKPPHEKIE